MSEDQALVDEAPMSHADWLRACLAWLNDPSMRSSVIEHIEEAADALSQSNALQKAAIALLDYTDFYFGRDNYHAAKERDALRAAIVEPRTADLPAEPWLSQSNARLEEFIDSKPVGEILSKMCFEFIELSRLWRETGTEIEHRAEAEQAFFMRAMLHCAATAGEDWHTEFAKQIRPRIDQAKAQRVEKALPHE